MKKIGPILDECTFYNQVRQARFWRWSGEDDGAGVEGSLHDTRLRQLEAVSENTSFACIKDIPDILSKSDKYVLVVSERNLKYAWMHVKSVTQTNRTIHIAYKQDTKQSYFVSVSGVQLPMRLGPHKYYLKVRLSSLVHSGVILMWEKWQRMRESESNEKLREIEENEQGPRAISMDNSWLSQVFKFCFIFCGVCFCVFALEVAFKYL